MTHVTAAIGGRQITLDPVMPTPTEVKLPRRRAENPIPAGFQIQWATGTNDGVTFDMTSGAGVGSSYMVLTLKRGDEVIAYEVVDLRDLLPDWIDAALADGPTPEGARP